MPEAKLKNIASSNNSNERLLIDFIHIIYIINQISWKLRTNSKQPTWNLWGMEILILEKKGPEERKREVVYSDPVMNRREK